MFGLGPYELSVLLGLLVLSEFALFWAATALGDVQDLGPAKLFTAVVMVIGIGAGLLAVMRVYYPAVAQAPFEADNRLLFASLAGGFLALTWLVPALAYAPLLSVSLPRSMLISVFQVLLRAFLYTFIIAIVMVVLAAIQIYYGTDIRL